MKAQYLTVRLEIKEYLDDSESSSSSVMRQSIPGWSGGINPWIGASSMRCGDELALELLRAKNVSSSGERLEFMLDIVLSNGVSDTPCIGSFVASDLLTCVPWPV